MWKLALMMTAQLVVSNPAGGGPCLAGELTFQPQVAGPAVCAPTPLATSAFLQDDDDERTVIYTGACGGSYKKDDGKNKCCDHNERPECYSDGECRCSYDPYCQSLCQPSDTCQKHDC